MNLKFAILTITLAFLSRNGKAEKEDNFDEEMIGGCCIQIMKNKTDTTTTFNFNSEMAKCVFEKVYKPISGLVHPIQITTFEGNNKISPWHNSHMILSGGFRPTPPIFDREGFPPTGPVVADLDSILESAMAPMRHPNFPFNYAGLEAQPRVMGLPQGGMGFPGQPQYDARTMQPRPIPMNPQQSRTNQNYQTQPQQHQAPRRSRRSPQNRQQGGASVISSGGGSSVISNGGASMINIGGASMINSRGSSVMSVNGNEMILEGGKGKLCIGSQKICVEIYFDSKLDYSKCKEPESDADCPAFVDELRQVRANSAKSSKEDKNE